MKKSPSSGIAFQVFFYSFLSGLLACFVSLFIKLALNVDRVNSYLAPNSSQVVIVEWILRVGFILASFVVNSLMWLFYTKSLNLTKNTLYASSLNKLSNFICSALFGLFLFDEKLNLARWLVGLAFLLVGLVILNEQQKDQREQRQVSRDKND